MKFLDMDYGKDERIVDYIKRDICEELLGLYEGVIMKANDDLMDLLVSIVDHTGEKFICLIDEWDALCREGQEKQIFAIWVIFLTIVRPKVLAFQIMKFVKNLRQP